MEEKKYKYPLSIVIKNNGYQNIKTINIKINILSSKNGYNSTVKFHKIFELTKNRSRHLFKLSKKIRFINYIKLTLKSKFIEYKFELDGMAFLFKKESPSLNITIENNEKRILKINKIAPILTKSKLLLNWDFYKFNEIIEKFLLNIFICCDMKLQQTGDYLNFIKKMVLFLLFDDLKFSQEKN